MSGESLGEFTYDPEPDKPWFEPGATAGHIVLWDGEPGPALVAKAVAVADDEGNGFFDVTSEFEECTVTDTREGRRP